MALKSNIVNNSSTNGSSSSSFTDDDYHKLIIQHKKRKIEESVRIIFRKYFLVFSFQFSLIICMFF